MAFPTEVDFYFFLDILLIFLMINYNLPLATIYAMMVIVGSMMYLVPVDFKLFKWIPMSKGNTLVSIAWGVGFGFAFIYLYNYIQTTGNIGQVFATTVFGESVFLGKIVFGVLIALIETRFFFRTLLQWGAWKTGWSVNVSPFSSTGIKLMVAFASIFTLFHLTAKGVTNNIDLILTFVFGAMSIGMILYFQQLLPAIIAHITVNSYGVGLLDIFGKVPTISPLYVIIGLGLIYIFFVGKKSPILRRMGI